MRQACHLSQRLNLPNQASPLGHTSVNNGALARHPSIPNADADATLNARFSDPPADILVNIIQILLEDGCDGKNTYTPRLLTVAAVNHRWRAIVAGTPLLWAQIHGLPLRAVQHHLKRSSGSLLNVAYYKDVCIRPNWIEGLLLTLVQPHRLKSLVLHLSALVMQSALLKLSDAFMPELETLELHIDDFNIQNPPDCDIPLHLTSARYPNLRSVSLLEIYFDFSAFHNEHRVLRSVRLTSVNIMESMSLRDILVLLGHLSGLERLELVHITRPDVEGSLADDYLPSVCLPSLKYICYADSDIFRIFLFLDSIVAPALEALRIHESGHLNQEANTAEAKRLGLVNLILTKFNIYQAIPYDQRRVTIRNDFANYAVTLLRQDLFREKWEVQEPSEFSLDLNLGFIGQVWISRLLEVIDPRELGYTPGFDRLMVTALVMQACTSVHTLAIRHISPSIHRPRFLTLQRSLVDPFPHLQTVVLSGADFGDSAVSDAIQSALDGSQLDKVYILHSNHVRTTHLDMLRSFFREVHHIQ
jgi:hypothetical protein